MAMSSVQLLDSPRVEGGETVTTFQAGQAEGANGEPVMVVSGDLDLASAEGFVESATAAAADVSVLHLDLGDVTFMDSTGLGALIKVRNLMIERGGSVALVNISSAVERVLELTGMSDVFHAG